MVPTVKSSDVLHLQGSFAWSVVHYYSDKGSVGKQSGNDVEGCVSRKFLFQPKLCERISATQCNTPEIVRRECKRSKRS